MPSTVPVSLVSQDGLTYQDDGDSTALQGESSRPSTQSASSREQEPERLIDRVTDPTAWLMDFRFRQEWNWPDYEAGADSQSFQFRPTIPFRAWDHVNLLRIAIPYNLEGNDGAGLGDIEAFDLVVFDQAWGRWGVGPSIRLRPQATEIEDSFQIGPAAGAVTKSKHWTVGLLMQNFLSEQGSTSQLQPILAFKFNDRWAVGIGQSHFSYDWHESIWTELPLGIQLSRITDFYGQRMEVFANPQYNFQDDASNSGWTLFFGLKLLVPDA
ncbi:MAG: hypothetical protein RIC12_01040 [Pirellulales bacterium]